MTENDEKQKALDGEKGIVENTTTHEHDRTYENEGSRDLSPMVQISIKEYDKFLSLSKLFVLEFVLLSIEE